MKTITQILIFITIFGSSLIADERFMKIDAYHVTVVKKVLSWSAVYDTESNLIWEVRMDQNNIASKSWLDAANYCETLVHANKEDWRLPNRSELKSIMDYANSGGVINSDYLPGNSKKNNFWSSTTQVENRAWYLNNQTGLIYYADKSSLYNVMCVRGGL